MSDLTIRPINTGFMALPKHVYFHSSLNNVYADWPAVLEGGPVLCFLIEGGDRPLLFDTGMSKTEWAHQHHGTSSVQPEGMSIIEQLKKLGYEPGDIGYVVLSHLHWDHCHYIGHFSNARFFVHPVEKAFAENPFPIYYKAYEHPICGIRSPYSKVPLELVCEGDEVIPGVSVLDTPGHSPGHIAAVVKTASGEYILTGDAAASPDNLKPVDELHYIVSPPGVSANLESTWHSLVKIKERAAGPDRVLCAHDKTLLDRIAKDPVLR
jgi:glyoxylase-like metal-dependent hydrolase (beta-lactamase superfamily II)